MTAPITLDLPKQNVAVVGSFNPAIFEPAWIKQHVAGVSGEIQVALALGGRPPIAWAGELVWIVSADRLVVHGPLARAGAFVADVLQTLPHTPLRAAGVNLLFDGQADQARFGPFALSVRAGGVHRLLRGAPGELSFSQVASRDDGVNVAVKLVWASERPDVVLDLNYHLEASGQVAEERAKQLIDHVRRAPEFEDDAQRIRRELLLD